MEEADLGGQGSGQERLRPTGLQLDQIAARRHVGGVRRRERLEEGRRPEVERHPFGGVLGTQGSVAGRTGAHRSHAIVRRRVEGAQAGGQGFASNRPVREEIALHQALIVVELTLLLVAPLDAGCRRLLIAAHRLVGRVGDAIRHQCAARPHEAITPAKMVVEEAERPSRRVPLDPEAQLTEVDRQGVEIHTKDRLTDHIAHRLAELAWRGLILTRPHAGQLAPHPPRRREQKGPRTAGRVDHPEGEDGLGTLLGRACRAEPRIQHGYQGALDQLLHQLGARIVATGRLALRPAYQLEARRASELHEGPIVEQALVDTTQLLHVQGRIVHAARQLRLAVVVEREGAHRREQVGIE